MAERGAGAGHRAKASERLVEAEAGARRRDALLAGGGGPGGRRATATPGKLAGTSANARPERGCCRRSRRQEPRLRPLSRGTTELAPRKEEGRSPPGEGRRGPGLCRKFYPGSGRGSRCEDLWELRRLGAAFKAPSHTRAGLSALLLPPLLASPLGRKKPCLPRGRAAELRAEEAASAEPAAPNPSDPFRGGWRRWHRPGQIRPPGSARTHPQSLPRSSPGVSKDPL